MVPLSAMPQVAQTASLPRRWNSVLVGAMAVALGVVIAEGKAPAGLYVPERPAEAALVEELEKRAVLYFAEQSDAKTGLVADRAPADGGRNEVAPSSIAATGFGLTSWCIAAARSWMPADQALGHARLALRFMLEHGAAEHGWFFHFLDPKTGARAGDCEVSTIDTALFLSGALTARQYFHDAEVTALVDAIYARIDWRWALNGGATLTHGWRPESGFISYRWDRYAELMGLYLLGIGAPANPLPPETWSAWRREPVVQYGGRSYIDCGPLFTHQYAHAWFDFRGQRDDYTDYWANSVAATLAQRDWCAAQADRFPQWSHDLWGLTASDSAHGYVAWGGPGGHAAQLADGTVVPCAPGGSLPFAPRECLASLLRMREVGGDRVWRRYGFVDAFNPQTGWTSPDVIGIDVGITLVMAENMRSELVWKIFMSAPEVRVGMWLAGFRSEAPGRIASTGLRVAAR